MQFRIESFCVMANPPVFTLIVPKKAQNIRQIIIHANGIRQLDKQARPNQTKLNQPDSNANDKLRLNWIAAENQKCLSPA